MPRILNQAIEATLLQGHSKPVIAGVAGGLFFAMAAAIGSIPGEQSLKDVRIDVVEQIATPVPPPSSQDDFGIVRESRIQRGDTVVALFHGLNVRDTEALEFLRRDGKSQALFRQLAPGKTLTTTVDREGRLLSLVFPLNGEKSTALHVQRQGEGFNSFHQDSRLETHVSIKSAVIRHSLFGASDAAGIPDGVAEQLADIFGGDIDFHRDLRKGDQFSVIYETATHLGRPTRTQRILAAEFVNNGKNSRAFLYRDKEGQEGYYDNSGRSVRKVFLRSPLEFSRITSGFSSARLHPVLNEVRAHKGIDYGAPIGTRVRATGDGIVEILGSQGGYGKMVQIRHGGDKTTLYGHLSGFAPGVKKGVRVNQGDIIGYVGATGLASGPHLHYEFRVGGVHRNPLAVVLPSAEALAGATLETFRLHVADMAGQLALAPANDRVIALLD